MKISAKDEIDSEILAQVLHTILHITNYATLFFE